MIFEAREKIKSPIGKNKHTIADAFGRSAQTYDQAAQIQQATGQYLIEKMYEYISDLHTLDTLVDVGCGTGFLTPKLINTFRPKQYIGVDLSEGMLECAAQNNAEWLSSVQYLQSVQWLQNDAEHLDQIADNSVDILFANFSLQWCENLASVSENFYRVLKPQGYICFSSLDQQSLHELRQAWSLVDKENHVNEFCSADQWRVALENNFSSIFYQQQTTTLYFETVMSVLKSLKAIGANTVKQRQSQALMGRQHFTAFTQAYECQRQLAGIPLSYIVDHWIFQKSH